MMKAVWILAFLVSLLPPISNELHPHRNVETRWISESIEENTKGVQKRWNLKQSFENQKRYRSPQMKTTWQNSNIKAVKDADVNRKYMMELKSHYGFYSVLNSRTIKWKNFKRTIFDTAHMKDGRKMNAYESFKSPSGLQRMKEDIVNTENPYATISKDRKREPKNEYRNWKQVDRLISGQVNEEYQTRDKPALELHKKRLARNRRFISLPSSQELPCDNTVSCHRRCSSSFQVSYNEKLVCYCDIYCEPFQDCCHDFDKFCQVSNGIVTQKNTNASLPLPQPSSDIESDPPGGESSLENKLWQCYKSELEIKKTNGFWMISSCPQSWQPDDVYHQCKMLSGLTKITLDNYQYPPVYTNSSVVFHNKFCAQCNGVASQRLKSYHLSLNCDLTPPDHLSTIDKVKFLFDYCNRISWKPKQGDPRRYCLQVHTDCSGNNLTLANECLDSNARLVSDNKCIYKNMKCASCKVRDISQLKCGPYGEVNKTIL